MRKFKLLSIFSALLFASILVSQLDVFSGGRMEVIPSSFSFSPDWLRGRDRLARLDTLKRVLHHIKESYVDPSRVSPEEMFKKSLERISQLVPEVRILNPGPHKAVLLVNNNRMEFDTQVATLYALHSTISDALMFVREHKESDITESDLEISAITGALSTLDPHSVYLGKELYDETKVGTTGTFGGLGIVIGIRENKLTVIAPLEDTPAHIAGIKAGDTITKIGDESTINMDLTEAVNKMRGPKGTPITISVLREGWTSSRDFTIVRDIIKIVSVESQLLPGQIGYVKLKSFQGNTAKDLNKHLKQLTADAGGTLKGLILDLRNDPGGLLDQAIAVADKFLGSGTIVSTVKAGNTIRDEEKATEPGTEPNYPMSVVVNGGSASASEIVAGALKRRDRAIVLGQRTFGKGTVQSIFELPDDAALKLTIGQYLTPGDFSIQSVGIAPDVRFLESVVAEDRMDVFRVRKDYGEVSLEHHFENPNSTPSQKEPQIDIRFVEERTDKQAAEEDAVPLSAQASREDKVKRTLKDFEIRTALDLLQNANSTKRKDLVALAQKRAPIWEKPEQQRLVQALATRGIDWAAPPQGKATGCTPPKAASNFVSPAGSAIQAGRSMQFQVTIENAGPCPLYRLRAVSNSKNYLFSEREFLFGKVDPGQKLTREVKVEVPKATPSSRADISLNFFEARNIVPKEINAMVAMKAASKPEFAFTFQVNDRVGPKGNGNGLIEKGESIELDVMVHNIGKGPTGEAFASVKNMAGKDVFLQRGRAPLPELKPGNEKMVSFLFEVSPSFSAHSFTLDLAVLDVAYRVALTKKLSFDVVPPGAVKTERREVSVKTDRTPVFAMPSATAPVVGRVSASSIFQSTGEFNNFMRVDLPKKQSGWIPKPEVAVVSKKRTDTVKAEMEQTLLQSPIINIDAERLAFEVARERFVRMAGNVSDDEGVKDVYIFINDKKVFYQNYSNSEDPASRPDQTRPFDTTVPLESGANRVVLVARDQQDLVQRKAFVIYRAQEKGETKKTPADDEDAEAFFMDPMFP
ncbi:MAG TPA: MXAN_5808 family serine peptidase [Bdellovibrionota bacterium]|nr:MXAN_5808 family serine peptidase [Bdellovibrionota bacterium]